MADCKKFNNVYYNNIIKERIMLLKSKILKFNIKKYKNFIYFSITSDKINI